MPRAQGWLEVGYRWDQGTLSAIEVSAETETLESWRKTPILLTCKCEEAPVLTEVFGWRGGSGKMAADVSIYSAKIMKSFFQHVFGLNGACIIRGFRFGPQEFWNACNRGLGAVYPFEGWEKVKEAEVLRSIPEVPLDEIIGDSKVELKFTVQRFEEGMLPDSDALALLSILAIENPREVLEIGTFMGYTTRRMAENLEKSTIHTIDLPLEFSATGISPELPPKDDFHLINRRVVGREFKGRDCEARIIQHFGDTAEMDFKKIGKPGFFFIDGSHTYEYCKQDSEKCLDLCAGCGVFLWHDCDKWHPGIARFICEWRGLGRNILRIKGTSLAYWKTKEAFC